MNCEFKRLTIHHFLSMGECEIDLSNRGFCLVSGINNNPKDAAKSNGSGKSTIWSALSFVLTGKTIQGITSGLPNKFYNDGCWVSLAFNVDGHEYEVTRSKEDKTLGSNLKIIVDGVDKSGKGIQESNKILEGLLPDLNEELIGSIIILGQGMPNRFTRNTPARRKEILEHLSKSDFMIDDLKSRINSRIDALGKSIREVEDSTLQNNTLKATFSQQLDNAKQELETLIKEVESIDLDKSIEELQTKLNGLNESIESLNSKITGINEEVEQANSQVLEATNQKQRALNKVRDAHDRYSKEDNEAKTKLNGEIYVLTTEINRLKSITDICPTCGQKIPNVNKPDTTQKENELEGVKKELEKLNELIAQDNEEYQQTLAKIDNEFNGTIQSLQQKANQLKEELRKLNQEAYASNSEKIATTQRLTIQQAKKDGYLDKRQRVEKSIEDLTSKIKELDGLLIELSSKGSNLKLHQDVINKMNTYVKRDFRGFLLSNVIGYIQSKAKEYCSKIFNTDEINFSLEGNNIDISFCGKPFELLSGGEQQRADLIIQFALRDMMCQYLNFGSNILVLDEITDNLDSVSCDRVLNFIANELKDIESVFIISHHSSELGICNDGEIIVMKDANGVSEITSQY